MGSYTESLRTYLYNAFILDPAITKLTLWWGQETRSIQRSIRSMTLRAKKLHYARRRDKRASVGVGATAEQRPAGTEKAKPQASGR